LNHDELMDRIYWHWRYVQGSDGLQAMTDYRRIILAVVKLHKPSEGQCYECHYEGRDYPCETIQAIEKELQ